MSGDHVLARFRLRGHEPIDVRVECELCEWTSPVCDGDTLADLARRVLGHEIAHHHDGGPV